MTTTAAVLTRMSHRRQPLLVVLILLSSVVQCVRSNSYDRPVAAEKKLVPSESSPQSLSASLARLPPRHPKRLSKRGRFSIDLQGNNMILFPNTDESDGSYGLSSEDEPILLLDSKSTRSTSTIVAPIILKGNDIKQAAAPPEHEISLAICPTAAFRLVRIAWFASVSFSAAFSGTLRLLAPLILARRSLKAAGALVYDYMRGRYIRKTYTKWESLYIHYYELPAVMRAIARTAAQLVILFCLSEITSHMIAAIPGMKHPFRPLDSGSCFWSGSLWALLCVGGGHLGGKALSEWGGKSLRIQVKADVQSARRLSRVFIRPWHIFQWMKDPEEWITTTITSARRVPLSNTLQEQQPFAADPILFPATWAPLRLLQMIGVAGTLSKPRVMTQFLIQVAVSDEWYRMLVSERRVTLGLIVAVCYLISTLSLILTVAPIDVSSSIFLIPHLLAVVVSTWMNVIIFWNRLEERHRETAVRFVRERSHAVLKAVGCR